MRLIRFATSSHATVRTRRTGLGWSNTANGNGGLRNGPAPGG